MTNSLRKMLFLEGGGVEEGGAAKEELPSSAYVLQAVRSNDCDCNFDCDCICVCVDLRVWVCVGGVCVW